MSPGPKEEQLHVEMGRPWLNKVESESMAIRQAMLNGQHYLHVLDKF